MNNNTTTPPRPDWLIAEPEDVYHAKRATHVTSHSLAEFRRCPALYRRKQLGLVPERDTSAYALGRAAHTLILEGREVYEAWYIVGGPVNERTGQPYGTATKAYAEWASKQDVPVLSVADAAIVEEMAASVASHESARLYLTGGWAEGVVRARMGNEGGVPCQARIDYVLPSPEGDGVHIVDLKTCRDLDQFEDDVYEYGYLYQLAWYIQMAKMAGAKALDPFIVAVEKREPYRCGVWLPQAKVIEQAGQANRVALSGHI